MAKNNYINSGVSDNDLISLAGQLQASKLAVPEKTTWDYIQEDLEEWQTAVKGRAAKFMEDLPEEFDLNKVEPEGRDAISSWYKTMRKDFMKAANNASLFDPGSFAYGDGASKMNKIEDNLSAVNGVFDNIKAVRTQAIKDKDNYASGVPESQKSMMNAIVSGEMFQSMVIKDGGIQFKVDGATYPDGQDYFTEEDIKGLRTKGSLSEEGINAVNANAEEDMINGIAFRESTYRSTLAAGLNKGKKTGENQDLMFDVGGINEDGSLNAEPYVTKYIRDKHGFEPGGEDYKQKLKEIKGNLSEFYNENEDDFIDNFLMPNARNVFKNTKMGEKAELALEKSRVAIEAQNQQIAASKTSQANTYSVMEERKAKRAEDDKQNKLKEEETVSRAEEAKLAEQVLSKNGSRFNYNGFEVSPADGGGYNVKDSKGNTQSYGNEPDMRGAIVLPFTGTGEANYNQNLKQKDYDRAMGISTNKDFIAAVGEGNQEVGKFLKKQFGDALDISILPSNEYSGDGIKIAITGTDFIYSNKFETNPGNAFWAGTSDKARAKEIMAWVIEKLKIRANK